MTIMNKNTHTPPISASTPLFATDYNLPLIIMYILTILMQVA